MGTPSEMDSRTASKEPTQAEELTKRLGDLAEVAQSLDTRTFNFLSRMNGANEPRGGKDAEETEGFFPRAILVVEQTGQSLKMAHETMDRLEKLV